jgi:hypothetical protein
MLLLTACGLVDTDNGQIEKYYFDGKEKVKVTRIPSKIIIYTNVLIKGIEIKRKFSEKLKSINPAFIVKFETPDITSVELIDKTQIIDKELIKNKISEAEHVDYAWYSSRGGEIVVYNDFHAQLKTGTTEEEFNQLNKKHDVTIARIFDEASRTYTLRFKWENNRDVFDYCMAYHKTRMFEWIAPSILMHPIH